MLLSCPTISCPGTDFPITNYSAEGVEPVPPFVSVVFPNVPPGGGIDEQWSRLGCVYVYVSYISQQDADLGALRQSVLCTNPPGSEIWYSAAATCCVNCPDGTEFCYTVPAGTFIASTYAAALVQAEAYACDQAQIFRVCLNNPECPSCVSNPPPVHPHDPNFPFNPPEPPNTTLGQLPRCACLGIHYQGTIQANGAVGNQIWSTIGSLPPGLTLVPIGTGATIIGIPTVSGTYAFQVIVTDAFGNYAIRTFTIQVVEVTTTSLPNFTIGTPYSYQLAAGGGSGNYTWSIATGILPEGLELSQSGLISGTPTALAVDETLTFEVRDATCEAAEHIQVTPRAALHATSSTRVLAYRGFREYTDLVGTGQLYKRVDYVGSITQIAFPNFNADPSVDATQCGGCQFIYSGYDQIDNLGNILNRHSKNMMVMCAASHPSLFEIRANPDRTAIITPILHPPSLYGYCWADDPQSCSACDPNDTTWSLLRNDAWFGAVDYPTDILWDSTKLVFTATSFTYAGNDDLTGGVILNPSIQGFPKNNGNDIYIDGFPFVRLQSSGGFSSALSEPYTDADANATAVVYTGTSFTAENAPNYQITGANNLITRRSRITSVAFEITCTRLIIGTDYIVSYELVTSNGVGSSHTVQFTADSESHVVTGTIPEPAANLKTTVKNARIRYA